MDSPILKYLNDSIVDRVFAGFISAHEMFTD
jgi:hypothetical protein